MSGQVLDRNHTHSDAGRSPEFTDSLIRGIYEVSPDGILVVNDQNVIVSHNKRFLEIWKFPQPRPPDEQSYSGRSDQPVFEEAGQAAGQSDALSGRSDLP